MSPRTCVGSHPDRPTDTAIAGAAARLSTRLGLAIHDERRRRGWSIQTLATRAGVAVGWLHAIENGAAASIGVYVRLSKALGRELHVDLLEPGQRRRPHADLDLVHAAMGEWEVAGLRAQAHQVRLDEPWQHYHFAGRADVLAWDVDRGALLHIENRTRFPDVQDAIGRFGTKRKYLATAVWRSLGFDRPPASETHAMVALWSAEVLRVLRQRPETFRATFPDPSDPLMDWFAGRWPERPLATTFALLDPFAAGRQRRIIDLTAALDGARPRVRGYAEAAVHLRSRQ